MTSNVKTGGPAFPTENEHQSGRSTWHHEGMSLRDYFAAKEMQAQLTAFWALETYHGWSHSAIAEEAYKMADAMLIAREK